jgi:hypothetical protein
MNPEVEENDMIHDDESMIDKEGKTSIYFV